MQWAKALLSKRRNQLWRIAHGGPARCFWNVSRFYNRLMPPTLIAQPARITAAGTKPKLIDEYIGRVNSKHATVSVAHMRSPQGWIEPGQTPEFDEFTVVLRGMLRVKSQAGELEVHAGQAVVARAGEWVQYSTPDAEGAEYIAVCLPAFSPETVNREE